MYQAPAPAAVVAAVVDEHPDFMSAATWWHNRAGSDPLHAHDRNGQALAYIIVRSDWQRTGSHAPLLHYTDDGAPVLSCWDCATGALECDDACEGVIVRRERAGDFAPLPGQPVTCGDCDAIIAAAAPFGWATID